METLESDAACCLVWVADCETSLELLAAFSLAVAASDTLLAISCAAAVCCSTAAAIAPVNAWISPTLPETDWMAPTAALVEILDRVDLLGNRVGCLGGLRRKLLHLGGHHRETAARLARTRRFDGGIQRQKIGLIGDAADHRYDGADLLGRAGKPPDILVRALGLVVSCLDDRIRPVRLI